MKAEIPVWERYVLTIEEAANYFRIGENRLRQIAKENKDAEFTLQVGTRLLIKRKKFEKFIDSCDVV